MDFHHATLDNGLEVIAETDPHALSAAVGFFVRSGSRDESPELAGVSHFLEHMAFKGNDRRSAEDVNRQFDEIGAKYNAFTSEEHTVYHAAVLPEYLPAALELVADLLRPGLAEEDFDLERKVILEEIGMYADMPMWLAYERAMRVHFAGHPLGNTVLGTEASIEELTPESMRAYYGRRYVPANVFVAATGRLEFERFLDDVKERCGPWTTKPVEPRADPPFQPGPSELLLRDQFVQQCFYLLGPGPASQSALRFPAEVLSVIIGDDTGSRFHWDLVEPGKVESAEFGYHEYEGTGLFLASVGCEPQMADENLAIVQELLDSVTREGVSQAEVEQARNKLGSRLVLAAERPQNRLFSLGYNWSYRREYRSVADDLAELESVTPAKIREVLDRYPLRGLTTIALGPLERMAHLGG